jgi:hypothetical protein
VVVAVRTKTRSAVVLAVALVSLLIAGPAWADGLPLPTPTGDAVTNVQTAVHATVGTAVQPVTQTVAPVIEQTQPAVTPVLEETQPVVDEVERVVPEPVRQVIGTVRGPVNQLPVPIATDAGKPVVTALRTGGKPLDMEPAPVSLSSPRSTEPATSGSTTRSRSTLRRPAQPTKRATRPAASKLAARRASHEPSVLTTPSAPASKPSNVPVLSRDDAGRARATGAADQQTRAPVSPPRDRDSVLAAASSAAAGSDLGKTVGLIGLLGLFLTPILLNAIRAEMGPFREPFLRRRARPG